MFYTVLACLAEKMDYIKISKTKERRSSGNGLAPHRSRRRSSKASMLRGISSRASFWLRAIMFLSTTLASAHLAKDIEDRENIIII